MNFLPIHYEEPLFRPPSEAYSFILQTTIGCSWNRCAFCEMYQTKKFQIRPMEDIFNDIDLAAHYAPDINKLFLADGDALIMPTKLLLPIFQYAKQKLPNLRRISSYALPRNIAGKSDMELSELHYAGLDLIYLGIESGSDLVLQKINKGESAASTIGALQRFHQAGIKSSVMLLIGLGGTDYSNEHASQSAKVVNETQPAYLSLLVVSFPKGTQKIKKAYNGNYQLPEINGLLKEIRLLVQDLDLKQTTFRSDHASNYLILKGQLNRDKNKILSQIDHAINNPREVFLRPEWMRGL